MGTATSGTRHTATSPCPGLSPCRPRRHSPPPRTALLPLLRPSANTPRPPLALHLPPPFDPHTTTTRSSLRRSPRPLPRPRRAPSALPSPAAHPAPSSSSSAPTASALLAPAAAAASTAPGSPTLRARGRAASQRCAGARRTAAARARSTRACSAGGSARTATRRGRGRARRSMGRTRRRSRQSTRLRASQKRCVLVPLLVLSLSLARAGLTPPPLRPQALKEFDTIVSHHSSPGRPASRMRNIPSPSHSATASTFADAAARPPSSPAPPPQQQQHYSQHDDEHAQDVNLQVRCSSPLLSPPIFLTP